jgi:glycosyltransferase involved in cell wall biosynthesis
MTRVALITYEFPPLVEGGAGVYAARLATELSRLGVDVTVFTRRARRPDGMSVRVVGVSGPRWGALGFWASAPFAYIREVKRHGRFDLVHGNGVGDLTLLRGFDPPPRVVTVHHLAADAPGGVMDRPRPKVWAIRGEGGVVPLAERLVVNRADHLIAVSHSTSLAVFRRFDIPAAKVTVIHLGVDEPKGLSVELSERDSGSGGLVLLSVARLEYRKGPDILLKAAERLVADGRDVRVVLAGSGPVHDYERLARDLGIGERVTLTGWVDEGQKAALFQACDIYVVPSRLEGFGLTGLEALAAGKPLVTTPIGAAQDGLIDEACGAIAEVATPAALERAIVRCIGRMNSDPGLGTRNRQRAGEFSWERVAKLTKSLYDDLIHKRL